MAKPNRDLPKRKLAQALKAQAKSQQILMQMHVLFSDGKHDEYVKLLEQIVIMHQVIITSIERFWKHAYGSLPDNPEIYAG